MMPAPDLPLWAAILVSVFIVAGAAITLIGAIGLVRLNTFYQRVHAPTLGATMGTALILLGSVVCFSVLQTRPVLHEVLIAVFAAVTTPVTLILLVRAALYRDREEGNEGVPSQD
jgi:multicomponent K+:H+ antiporter subunit G